MSLLRRNPGGVRPPGPFARTVSGATRRLGSHTLALGFAVAAVGALLAWVAWSSINGVPLQDRYTLKVLIPDGSPVVTA